MDDDVSQVIRAFIVDSFLFGDAASLPIDADSLIDGGIVDSTGVLELVAFIEDRFGFSIADADIVPANLDSIASITAFVQRKSAVALAA